MGKKWYYVTDRAGRYVAGIRTPANRRILLTENQAAYELQLGSISETDPALAQAEQFQEDSKAKPGKDSAE